MIRALVKLIRSFGYAFRGLYRTTVEERNFRIHLTAVLFVTWFAFLYEASPEQFTVLCLLYGAVLCLELINTALEKTVDLITDEYAKLAERAKDSSAAAVLISAIASVIVAVLTFRDPAHWSLVWDKLHSPFRLGVFLILAVASLFFIKGKPPKK